MSENEYQYSINDYQFKQVEVRLRLEEAGTYYSGSPILSADDAVQLMTNILKDIDREWLCVINLDNRNCPINFNVVSIGGIDQTLAPIQNIIKSAILCNATRIMMLHTHPSGDTTPSRQDVVLTKRVYQACMLMGIPLQDHVIIGCITGQTCSMLSAYPECFPGRIEEDEVEKLLKRPERKKPDKCR